MPPPAFAFRFPPYLLSLSDISQPHQVKAYRRRYDLLQYRRRCLAYQGIPWGTTGIPIR